MNCLILFVCAIAFIGVQADETAVRNKLNEIAHKCKDENRYSQDVLAIAATKNIPTNEKERCFLECVYKKVGLVKNNVIDKEGAQKLAKERFGTNQTLLKQADDLYEKCKKEVVVDPSSKEKCQIGRLLRTCFVKYGGSLPFAFNSTKAL